MFHCSISLLSCFCNPFGIICLYYHVYHIYYNVIKYTLCNAFDSFFTVKQYKKAFFTVKQYKKIGLVWFATHCDINVVCYAIKESL